MRLVQRFRDSLLRSRPAACGRSSTRRLVSTSLAPAALAAVMITGAPAFAAPQVGASAGATQASQARLLEDFLHYLRIAKPDLAAASAQALFDTGISDAELATLVDERDLEERIESVLRTSRGMNGVQDLVAEFEARLEIGRQDLARDPDRVDTAVNMLTGTRRQQMLARQRLAAAGEYAVPALVNVIVESNDPALELAATDMLIEIKRQAVLPISEAIGDLDPASQRKLANVLGSIGWPHAAPYLYAVGEDESLPADVRNVAMQNHRRLESTSLSLSNQLADLAMKYFEGEQSLVAFPGEERNNLWSWDPFVGLVPQPVPTVIFGDIMAMKLSREALRIDPDNARALAIFVAANLKRENNLPADLTDPIFGDSPFSPQFYATSAGPATSGQVLAMGIDRFDTPLVRDAIAALSETAGNASMFRGAERQTLLEALVYPDRRVQIESALALAKALPQISFPGDYAVVPLLASAVRTGNQVYAAVVASIPEDRQVIASRLRELGFTVLNAGSSLAALESEIASAPGVELVVVRGSTREVRDAVDATRRNAKTVAAPVVAVATAIDKIDLDREFDGDRRVVVWQAGQGDEAFAAAVENVLMRTSGGRMTEAESMEYAIESLDAMRAIAVSNSQVFAISDAEGSLIEALDSRTGGVRLLVADVLAMIDTDDAQRALLSAALGAADGEQVELLDRVAASARRYGNRAFPGQIESLLDLIRDSDGQVADAAARVHGAMNLPASNTVQLILE